MGDQQPGPDPTDDDLTTAADPAGADRSDPEAGRDEAQFVAEFAVGSNGAGPAAGFSGDFYPPVAPPTAAD